MYIRVYVCVFIERLLGFPPLAANQLLSPCNLPYSQAAFLVADTSVLPSRISFKKKKVIVILDILMFNNVHLANVMFVIGHILNCILFLAWLCRNCSSYTLYKRCKKNLTPIPISKAHFDI